MSDVVEVVVTPSSPVTVEVAGEDELAVEVIEEADGVASLAVEVSFKSS